MSDPTAAPPEPEPTLEQLREQARDLNIAGRSKMTSDELVAAIAEAQAANDPSQQPTPELDGRPPLDEVARQDAIDRAPTKIIGELPDHLAELVEARNAQEAK